MRVRSPRSLLWVSLFLGACASKPPAAHYERAVSALQQAQFREAYRESRAALLESPDDRKVQRFAERMRVVAILDEARSRILNGAEREGMSLLARVLTYHPDNEIAKAWQKKARDQLGRRLLTEGQEAIANDDAEKALGAFQEALSLLPGSEPALRGLREVRQIYEQRTERSTEHYHNALLARRLADWQRTLYHADATLSTDPTNKHALYLVAAAKRQVATELKNWAEKLVSEQHWAAAGKELLQAVELAKGSDLDWTDEANKKAQTYLDEHEAAQCYAEAEMRIAGKDFELARKQLEKADKLSHYDRVYLNELQGMLAAAEKDERYSKAQFLELSYSLEEALDIYRSLAKQDREGLAASKVENLEKTLQTVSEFYKQGQEAQAAGETEQAIEAYRRLLSLHPLYRDAAQRLTLLEQAKAAAQSGTQEPSPGRGKR